MATGVSILVVVLVATVNMMPADVDTFTVTAPDEESKSVTIRITKLADGGWKVVEPAEEKLGTFYVKGTVFTTRYEDEDVTLDLAEMLGVDENTDWKTLTEIKTIKIKNQENGIDFVIKPGDEGDESELVFKARWGAQED
jgi:hypothetical protein